MLRADPSPKNATFRFARPGIVACLLMATMPADGLADSDRERVTIVLAGDTGFSPNQAKVMPLGSAKHGRFLTWDQATALIAGDIDGDINFLNLESVVTGRNNLPPDGKGQTSPYNFRTHPNGLRHLVRGGFNVIALANNHSMDYGEAGLRETLRHAEEARAVGLLAHAGIGLNRRQAAAAKIFTVNGSAIAFSATGIVTNGLDRHRAGKRKPGQTAYRRTEDFGEVLARLARTEAAYRILSIHYGKEYDVGTDARQTRDWRRRAALKAGIDLIAGHHAHVVRGVEIAGGSIIFYGLGNFLHHGTRDLHGLGPCRDYGLVARVHLARAAGGRLVPRAIEAIPVTDTHLRTRRFKSAAEARLRLLALNSLGARLDNPAEGVRGVRFAPQPDGTGLYCLPGAGRESGRIGALCRSWRPAPAVPPGLRRAVLRSCGDQ